MQTEYSSSLHLHDACHAVGMPATEFIEIVSLGILAPAGDTPETWVFDLHMISTARRALRLQRDLHLDWEAVALVLDLLSERDRLQAENQHLQRRLQRLTGL
jgi:chaperone modulatory protein CbpM